MGKQWHPLFTHLLGLLMQDYYDVQPEVPVSDLPRRGDLLVIRRQGTSAPFTGLWSHLTAWNVLEFKGPTDEAAEEDLDLLLAVGSGLGCRLNEERRGRGEPRLANRELSLWLLAPTLGDTIVRHALDRAAFVYEGGGLWMAKAWGHPIRLLAYRDAMVEVDSIPLRLLDPKPGAPRGLGELLVTRQDLLDRFLIWLHVLQPALFEEVRNMAGTTTSIIDWEAVGRTTDLGEIVRLLPPERVIGILGVDRAIEAIGLPRVIEAVGWETFLRQALADATPEQLQAAEAMLRQRQARPPQEEA